MKRSTIILAVAMGLVAALAVVAGLQWRDHRRQHTALTDGGQVRISLEAARPRTVVWSPPIALDDAINSNLDEYEPRISADGRTMLFVRGKTGENADIFLSERIGWPHDRWTQSEALAEINTEHDELGPELTREGNMLYFHSNRPGGLGGYDLWRSKRGDSGWSEPENLGPTVNSSHDEYGACISPDGSQLMFASNRPRPDAADHQLGEAWSATLRANLPRNDFDLFATKFEDGQPGEAKRIEALNSEHNEGSTTFSPHGDFVWFCSDRPGGSGGFDLYRARVRSGSFDEPINVGPELNSPFNELDPALAMAGFELYFGSDRYAALSDSQGQRYDILRSESREVLEEVEDSPWIDWASLWNALLPALMWLLWSLLALLLFLLLLKGVRSRRLSLLMRCLLASLLVHVIVMLLLTLWEVTTTIAGIIRPGSGTKVILHAQPQDGDIASQIRSSVTSVDLAMIEPSQSERSHNAAPSVEAAFETHSTAAQNLQVQTSAQPLPAELNDVMPRERRSRADAQSVMLEMPAAVQPSAHLEVSPAHHRESQAVAALPTEMEPTRRAHDSEAVPRVTAEVQLVSSNASAVNVQLDDQRAVVDTNATVMEAVPVSARTAMTVQVDTPTIDSQAYSIPSDAPVRDHEVTAELSRQIESIQSDRVSFSQAAVVEPPQIQHVEASERAPIDVAATPIAHVESPEWIPDAVPRERESVAHHTDVQAIDPLHIAVAGVMETTPQQFEPRSSSQEGYVRFVADVPTQSPSRIAVPVAGTLPEASVAEISSPAAMDFAFDVNRIAEVEAVDIRVPLASSRETPNPLADLPRVALAMNDVNLGLPTETSPPVNPYVQRAEDVRRDLVERMGGSDATEAAVNRALSWLAAHQSEDGRWASEDFDDECGKCGGKGRFDTDIATTGLALLCFLGADHTHRKDGAYSERVSRAIDWLLVQVKSDGDIRGDETMYSHGIATIALSEAFGMTRDERLEEPVRKAIAFIASARNRTTQAGGWRYEPGQMGDTSVLGWQVMALISARRAGIAVDDEALAAAATWMDHVSTAQRPGRYAYQPGQRFTPSMTAEGLFVLQLLGKSRDEPRMLGSVEYVLEHPPHWDDQPNSYYWYYATLALFQHSGEPWSQWNESLTRVLLENQRTSGSAAGSWDPHDNWSRIGGRVYQTALCTLCLEVYYRYLPMYAAVPMAGTESR